MSKVHQPPDVGAQVAALARQVEELGNTVRRGKPAPNFRDLADADLTKIADGEVPMYDSTTGRFSPGTAGGAPPTAYFGTSGTNIADLGAGGTNIDLFEAYNYGSLFTLDGGGEWINIARPCIVAVTAWFYLAAGPAGLTTLELTGLDTENVVPDVFESASGGRMALSVATTDLWDSADDLLMHAYHDDTGSTYHTSKAALCVTYVRDA